MIHNTYKLYNFYISSASWRVRIALNYKKIPYEYISVDVVDSQDYKNIEYTLINPNQVNSKKILNFIHSFFQRVPTLAFKNTYIAESPAILQYLEDTHPEPPLFTKDFIKNAQIRAFSEIINSSIQPMQNIGALRKIKSLDSKIDNQEWVQFWINRGFNGKYCFGDQITMADVYFYPQAMSCKRFKIDLTKYPYMGEVLNNLQQIKEFQLSQPENFPVKQNLKSTLRENS